MNVRLSSLTFWQNKCGKLMCFFGDVFTECIMVNPTLGGDRNLLIFSE